MKTSKFLKMVRIIHKNSAVADPVAPNGAVYAICVLVSPCAILARTKQMWETRIDIHVNMPKVVTRLTKYPNTTSELSETFTKAMQAKAPDNASA
jgi:hypothetical protein